MGMIRRADIESYTREATVMNLGDLESQGQSIIRVATEQATKIIADANAERDRLLSGASEEGHRDGFAQGHSEGLKAGRDEGYAQALEEHQQQIQALTQLWSEQLAEFASSRDAMYQQGRRDVIELAALIAERITRRTISIDPTVVGTQMESVLETLARPTGLVLRVHPDDLAYAEKVLPGLIADCTNCAHAEVMGDSSLQRGSCKAETEGRGVIDASISTQLDRMVEELLPGQTAARNENGPRVDDGTDQNTARGDAA